MTSEQERLIKTVQTTTRNLLSEFSNKTNQLLSCDNEIKQLINEGVDYKRANKTATEIFQSNTVSFLAIDGTQSQDEEIDMLIFYSGAFGYKGQVQFNNDKVSYSETLENISPLNISLAVSIHEEDAANVAGKLTESGMEVDIAKFPSILMQFAEYYMAVKEVSNDTTLKVVILDRMSSIDIPHLVGNSMDFFESNESILLDMDTPFGKVSKIDIELSRMLHPNDILNIPCARSQLIKYSAINWLIEK